LSSSPAPRRRQQGFSLLEALCAFLILSLATSFLTQVFSTSMNKGTRALEHRELREAADTIWRKMIYESHLYQDGASQTLDHEFQKLYGGKSSAPRGFALDRWAAFHYVLEMKLKTVAGTTPPDSDAEQLFGRQADDDDEGSPFGVGDDEVTDTESGLTLMHMTMKIFETEGGSELEPLLVLSTWIRPPETGTGSTPR
jgi:type II secretory pathway pseudopilin PulG